MKEEALKLVWARDVEEGQGWSNDSNEIAHILYETRDEVTCNSFALLYNNLLWTPRVPPTAEKE